MSDDKSAPTQNPRSVNRLGPIPGLRTIDRMTPKNPTLKTVLGPQLPSNNFFQRRLGRVPSTTSKGEGPSNEAGINKGKGRAFSEELLKETTFQARIKDRVIGSSAANWRRTENPPAPSSMQAPVPEVRPPAMQSDLLASLIAEMRLQRKEDRARHKDLMNRCDAENVRSNQRALLDEDAKISAIVNAALKKLKPEQILNVDGSNIQSWDKALGVIAFERFQDEFFYTPEEDAIVDPYQEKIARGIIHSSVHPDLMYDLIRLENSAEVYNHLLVKFRVVNRAKQLQAWETLKNLNPSDYGSSAEVISAFNRCAKTFIEQGIEFTWDNVTALIFQSNLKDHLRPALDRKVDLFMETRDFQLPASSDVLQLWDSGRIEHRLAEETGRSDTSAMNIKLASRSDNVTLASRSNTSVSGTSSAAEEGQQVSALALNKPPICYICKQTGHYATNCPTSRKNNPSHQPVPSRPNPNSQPQFPPCLVTYNFDRVPYIKPIQTESRDPASTKSASSPFVKPKTTPTMAKTVETRQINPDLFADDEAENVEYVIKGEDLSAEPSGQRFNLREMIIQRDGQEVIWDSGASDNVTGDRYALHDFVTLEHPIAVKVATDSNCDYITGMGTLKFVGMNKAIIVVKKVFYCERARSTLLSIAAFKKSNAMFFVNGNFDSIDLVDGNGSVLLHSEFDPIHNTHQIDANSIFKSPNLVEHSQFTWNPEELTNDEKKLLFWHRLFGHASLRKIRRMVKLQLGYGLPTTMPTGSIKCPVCLICKATRTSALGPTKRCVERLSVVCVNLMGPFDTPTMTGGKYALTIRDVFTSYSEVRILKAKSEAADMITQTITRWENQTNCKVKILRSDNGGEFESKVFGKYLGDKGIVAERSLPYHHFQNGAAERYNRTVADMGRSILYDSELGKEFWGYAFLWAAWTLNRIPNRITKDKTPYEFFFGDKPQLDWTRVFGSKAYILVAPEKRKKLDERAVEGLVVGHLPESKGWMFWIPKTKKLVSSAWADFGRNALPSGTVTSAPIPEKGSTANPPHPSPAPEAKHMVLNDFSQEELVEHQETLVDKCMENCADSSCDVPSTFKAAMQSPDAAHWKLAINTELENLKRKNVWVVKKLPSKRRKLGARWVFAKKTNPDGSIKYKARYVAKGFNQKEGTDFAHTFAPTATFTSMRILLTIAARNNWPIYNFDFVAAYLNAPIDEEVWVQAPEGLDVNVGEACLLRRALYRTKQAVRCWWKHLSGTLASLGYVSSYYDSSVYTLSRKEDRSIIWVHVDDGIVTGSSDEALKLLEQQLKGSLEIKWTEGLTSMVGVKIFRNQDGFDLTQPLLIDKILKERWDGVTLHSTPLPEGYTANTDTTEAGINSTDFLSTIGSLSYVAVGTRPDIAYSVNYLARFSSRPSAHHWKGLRHLLGYLAETKVTPLRIAPDRSNGHPVECFVDANWGGTNSRSTYGVIIRLYGSPIMWVSRRLVTVASSTCQAEYMALGHATRHALWIRNLLSDIVGVNFPVMILCDNQSAVKIGCEDASNKRTHHIEREFYITNQALYEKKTSIKWIPGKEQIADVLTKALGKAAHQKCRTVIQGLIT
ncbi:hypothetical protein PtA15_1A107 [Puccinia triticina]|uniref:Integrase catalytic domain-containing protein n=1 Tax=Puccinia triticina TaxID=208348 RepID=A0ABY7C7U3_9BASI|nr:uncharacterized protein PtA15_1A107 [Puccinia triticina]WAQ80769.1 hypothetical protein PtA15_1A107 [Puccinia triticina]